MISMFKCARVISLINNHIVMTAQLPHWISSATMNHKQVNGSPPCPSRCPPRRSTTTRAGESRVVTAQGSQKPQDFLRTKDKSTNRASANHCLRFVFFTFLVHCLTVMTSSEMTMSTHLVQGSLIFPICLFTMVSKAMSGVKRPVLPDTERTSHGAERPVRGRERDRKTGGGRRQREEC